ncbi:MAG: hypothetical protein KJ887_02030 [Candidatus Omnitrophica bacterium]|nr:hypothetical protein [Candidatus Omnitrophota bacterium]MBU1047842.1 hypothetical protein [Candidatus Omnitrophota bacterium]MBU1630514.1 hypothetical protein [Candidatus Omnitrophota bacterium]MBU1766887.1 hypothetical protein [Candidatus Omnitrophota bacterium]MBU1888464.1 hypothetical protein [Candidatus Omnitrophota bacterium]
MTKIRAINPNREWETIKFETHYNKPQIDGPYPQDIINRRTLLLFAQRFLADYQSAKSRKYKSFFGELYQLTKDFQEGE